MNRIPGPGLPIFEVEVSEKSYEAKLRGMEEQIKTQLNEKDVGIDFIKEEESGKIVRLEVSAFHPEKAVDVQDILASIQDQLIKIGVEEEDELTREIQTIRSKYSKRKTTAFNKGIELLHGHDANEGKNSGGFEAGKKKSKE